MCRQAVLRGSFRAVTLAALAALPSFAWSAGRGVVPFAVTAEVSPSAVMKFDFKPTAVRIDRAALARGYVDISNSSYLSMNTGRVVPMVVVLDFAPVDRQFSSVEVRVENAASDGVRAAAARGREKLPRNLLDEPRERVNILNYRFNLGPGARPGTYFVPLTLNVGL